MNKIMKIIKSKQFATVMSYYSLIMVVLSGICVLGLPINSQWLYVSVIFVANLVCYIFYNRRSK